MSDDKQLTCEICGYQAKTSQGLAGHQRLAHALKGGRATEHSAEEMLQASSSATSQALDNLDSTMSGIQVELREELSALKKRLERYEQHKASAESEAKAEVEQLRAKVTEAKITATSARRDLALAQDRVQTLKAQLKEKEKLASPQSPAMIKAYCQDDERCEIALKALYERSPGKVAKILGGFGFEVKPKPKIKIYATKEELFWEGWDLLTGQKKEWIKVGSGWAKRAKKKDRAMQNPFQGEDGWWYESV